MIDLSKAKAGDVVHFRCGGSEKIGSIYSQGECGAKIGQITICFGSASSEINYCHPYWKTGAANNKTDPLDDQCPFDIIRIEPKAFDWKEVKAGMAFKDKIGRDVFYIGPNLGTLTDCGFPDTFFHQKYLGDVAKDWGLFVRSELTRAPEHDITPEN